ncbi:MAG: hypothetical protein HZB70_04180 [Candidatus Berkelbacteria bacterium]|nr:MAG: hypothetical protein HZB70_04180 [Candidatus Berkelbacteria bacterium]QQG51504.1 MAG: hypothetical protein HY845_03010 [Candidatus Berkelbacteria bacterium]
MKSTKLTLVMAFLALVLMLAGCAGEGVAATSNQFSGRFSGDIVFEAGGRGGGPSLQLYPFTISDDGTLAGTATFQDEQGSHQGPITGTLTPSGKFDLSTKMEGLEFTASGQGLRWVVESQTRGGGPSQYVLGTVTVTQRKNDSPYGQVWANSRVMFWQE